MNNYIDVNEIGSKEGKRIEEKKTVTITEDELRTTMAKALGEDRMAELVKKEPLMVFPVCRILCCSDTCTFPQGGR